MNTNSLSIFYSKGAIHSKKNKKRQMVAKTNFFLNFFENSRKFFLVPVAGLVQHALNCFNNFLCQYNAIVVGLIPT